jgi:hypothetical protein
MIERLIYTALSNGIQELKDDPDAFNLIFADYYGLSQSETDKIRTYFLANIPSVIHSYARENSSFPLYAIVLQEEQETTKVLGEYGGMVSFDDALALNDTDTAGADINSSMFTYSYEIIVYAKLPDVALYNYYLAKYFMIRERQYFISNDLFDLELGGSDLAPDPRYMPSFLFGRSLRFSCQREMNVIGDAVIRGSKLAGAHIEGGAPSISIKDTVQRNVTAETK